MADSRGEDGFCAQNPKSQILYCPGGGQNMGAGQKFIFFILAPEHGTPKKITYSESGGSL